MVNKNKDIIKHCPNFYKIMNFDYVEGDFISEKLISVYEDYLFNSDIEDPDQIKNIEYIDKVISKYIDDYNFRKEMKLGLVKIKVKSNSDNLLKVIIESIIKIFENYEEGYTRNIYFSRWI